MRPPKSITAGLALVALLAAGWFVLRPESNNRPTLRVAVTTSTRDSGLLDLLIPRFEKLYDVDVDVIAVGSGAALKLGQQGDVDVLLVHSPEAERAFMEAGYGVRREDVMSNSFVLLGPPSDPARVSGSQSAADALSRILAAQVEFVSRGDQSGTHRRELKLWESAVGDQRWEGYRESGQGMGPSLLIASNRGAYVLSDSGTFLRMKSRVDLVRIRLVDSGDLRNPYGVLVVNAVATDDDTTLPPGRLLANQFADYLISDETQELIGDYKIDGEALFQPIRGSR